MKWSLQKQHRFCLYSLPTICENLSHRIINALSNIYEYIKDYKATQSKFDTEETKKLPQLECTEPLSPETQHAHSFLPFATNLERY